MNLQININWDKVPTKQKDLQGWNSESVVFEELIKKTQPKTIIEVGTWKGASAIHMAEICKREKIDAKIICVDSFWGGEEIYRLGFSKNNTSEKGTLSVLDTFLSNVKLTENTQIIYPFPQTTKIASRMLQQRGVGAELIYVDASHDEEDVVEDIKYFLPLLRKGGILFGDDYSNSWPSVVSAVNKTLTGFTVKDRKWIYVNE